MAKGPDAFRTISEAADEVGVPQHVLRFWETKFTFIKPMKRAGGRRFYRPADLDVLRTIRRLLHEEGYTIKGVQRLHKEGGAARFASTKEPSDPEGAEAAAIADAAEEDPGAFGLALDVDALEAMLRDLEGAKSRLDALLAAG